MKNLMRLMLVLTVVIACAACSVNKPTKTPAIGVALYSFNRFPLEEALQKAKQSGVQYVEGFSFHTVGGKFGDQTLASLDDSGIAEVQAMLQANDLQLVSMYADGKTSADWEMMFKKGKQLGLSFLVGEPEPHLWDELNTLAAQYQMKLAIHQHAKGESRFWHPDSVLAALEGRENFAVCGDLGHWVRSGLDPVESLKQLEGRLISIHAKDLDSFGNIDATDVNPGQGVIGFEAVFAELKRQNFSGHLFVECEHNWDNNLNDVKEAVSFLKEHSKVYGVQ